MQVAQSAPRGPALALPGFLAPAEGSDGSAARRRAQRREAETANDVDRRSAGSPATPSFAALLAGDHGALAAQARQNETLATQSLERGADLREQQRATEQRPAGRAALAEPTAQRAASPAQPATQPGHNADAPPPATDPDEHAAAGRAATHDRPTQAHATAAAASSRGRPDAAPRFAATLNAATTAPEPSAQQPQPTAGPAAPVAPAPVVGASQGALPIVGPSPAVSAAVPAADRPRIDAASSARPSGSAATPSANLAAPGMRQSAPNTVAGARSAPPSDHDTGDFDANLSRILRFIRTRIDGEKSTTHLRLDPPALGTLRLRLDLQHAGARLEIETSTPLAHRLLSEQLDALRQGLEASGIRLEHAAVRPPAEVAAADRHPTGSPHAGPHHEGRPEQEPGAAFDESNAFARGEGGPGTEAHADQPADRAAGSSRSESAAEADLRTAGRRTAGLNLWA